MMRQSETLALLALALMVGTVAAQAPVCIVTTAVDAAKTALSLGGTVSSPTNAAIQPGGTVSATGSIYVVLPTVDGKCPTAAGLPGAISKAYIANPASKPGITIADITAQVGSLASINVNQIAATVAANIADDATKALTTGVTVTTGTAVISSFLGDGTQSLNSANFIGSGCTLGSTGGNVTITCPTLSLVYPLSAQVSGLSVQANLVLSGKLESVGELAKAVVNATAPADAKLAQPAAAAGRRLMRL